VFAKSLTAAQCVMTRDAIARNLYKRIFDWALQLINDSLHPGNRTSSQLASCLGILDIFGFENLHYNSFEQLCANYAAEVFHKVRKTSIIHAVTL
jgi:myosin-5